ncbi:MAG TPA: 50S ribosomal protein L22 [Armatimonadota bacterium]|nr:50S ribosomal protein L22 [Armatimonadota bacterium]
MEARAVAKHVRCSPYKLRRIMSLIRNQPVPVANAVLDHLPSPSARIISKVLKSAMANAEFNYDTDPDDCTVAGCWVDEGVTLKRWEFRSRGMVNRIRKRTSHVTIVLSNEDDE